MTFGAWAPRRRSGLSLLGLLLLAVCTLLPVGPAAAADGDQPSVLVVIDRLTPLVAKPDATVLWTSRQTYLGIGYTPEDADSVARTLTEQAKSLGVTDAPKTE